MSDKLSITEIYGLTHSPSKKLVSRAEKLIKLESRSFAGFLALKRTVEIPARALTEVRRALFMDALTKEYDHVVLAYKEDIDNGFPIDYKHLGYANAIVAYAVKDRANELLAEPTANTSVEAVSSIRLPHPELSEARLISES